MDTKGKHLPKLACMDYNPNVYLESRTKQVILREHAKVNLKEQAKVQGSKQTKMLTSIKHELYVHENKVR